MDQFTKVGEGCTGAEALLMAFALVVPVQSGVSTGTTRNRIQSRSSFPSARPTAKLAAKIPHFRPAGSQSIQS
jgi:hypothetical protein